MNQLHMKVNFQDLEEAQALKQKEMQMDNRLVLGQGTLLGLEEVRIHQVQEEIHLEDELERIRALLKDKLVLELASMVPLQF